MEIRATQNTSLTGLAATLAAMFVGGAVFGAVLARSVAPVPVVQPGVGSAPLVAPPNGPAAPAQPGAEAEAAFADPGKAETLAGARPGLRIGREDAPVQIVSFEDPQCTFCKQLSQGPMQQLLSEFGQSGKVAITYRHFPILGPESVQLATALECAAAQGKFEALHSVLVLNTPGSVSVDAWASTNGVDKTSWAACLASPATRKTLDDELTLGKRFRVQGTPTLFVNGRRIVGLMPYDMLKSTVEQALLSGGG